MRVLLTGATGFVGKQVLTALAAVDCEIVAITSRTEPMEGSAGIKWVRANLLDEHECATAVMNAQADILIHMAWFAEHGKFWSAPENFDWSRATLQLFQAFIRIGGKRAVFAGTCAEYDWQYGYCTEGVTPTEPSTIYGQCKDAARRLTKALAQQSGVEWVWGRIFSPFGIGEPENRLLPSVINSLLRHEPVLCSHGQQYRDFMAVEEVAAAFAHLACKTNVSGEFNVSTGKPTRLSALVDCCVNHLKSEVRPQYGAVRVSDNDPPMLVGDNLKLKSTGWKPQTDWSVALPAMIEQYKQLFQNGRNE